MSTHVHKPAFFCRCRHRITFAPYGLINVNGRPLDNIEPQVLKFKLLEPILLLGQDRFSGVDIRVRVRGGGHVAQIYAIRQAISKALVAYYQKYVDEA
ncbi:unnamed protein product, partial [Oppiella nova]